MARSSLGLAGSNGFIATVGWLIVGAGAGLGLVRFVGGTPAEKGVEGAMGALALGAVVAAPGLLAFLGLDRPVLLVPAGSVLVPLSFLSFSGVMLPLLIPAVMLFVAYGRRTSQATPRLGRAVLTTTAVLVLLVAAAMALLVHEDPRQYATASVSGGTSDVITALEASISLLLVGAALAAGRVLGAPEHLQWSDSSRGPV